MTEKRGTNPENYDTRERDDEFDNPSNSKCHRRDKLQRQYYKSDQRALDPKHSLTKISALANNPELTQYPTRTQRVERVCRLNYKSV